MWEAEIKIAYINKHMYKERKETTHVEIGEEQHTSSYIYTCVCVCVKINTTYVKMVTRPVYKKLKEASKTVGR